PRQSRNRIRDVEKEKWLIWTKPRLPLVRFFVRCSNRPIERLEAGSKSLPRSETGACRLAARAKSLLAIGPSAGGYPEGVLKTGPQTRAARHSNPIPRYHLHQPDDLPRANLRPNDK